MKKLVSTLLSALLIAAASAQAATLIYDGTSATPTGLVTGITGGTISQYNNNGTTTLVTTTSASSGYTGSTGTSNYGAAARIGALNTAAGGSAAFEFTLDASAGFTFTVTNIQFGERSTSTGPQAFSLRSSLDGFASDLATGTVANNSTWVLSSPSSFSATSAVDGAITFRLFGYSGAGSASAGTANWRVDDIAVTYSVSSVPEPSTYALLGLGLGALLFLRRKQSKV